MNANFLQGQLRTSTLTEVQMCTSGIRTFLPNTGYALHVSDQRFSNFKDSSQHFVHFVPNIYCNTHVSIDAVEIDTVSD